MNTSSRLALFVAANLAGALCAGLVLLGSYALADRDASTDEVPRLIPYNGTMTFEGQPVDAKGADARWLRFDVYDANVEVFSQTLQVEVDKGNFSALLGPTDDDGTALEDVVRDADDLQVSITVLNDPDDESDDVAMSNPQRLAITPYALWATHGLALNVGNELEVARDLNISGDLQVRNIENLGALNPAGGDIATGAGGIDVGGDFEVRGDATLGNTITDRTTVGGTTSVGRNLSADELRALADVRIGGTLFTPNVEGMDNINQNTGGTVLFGGDVLSGATSTTVGVPPSQTEVGSGANGGLYWPGESNSASDSGWVRFVGSGGNGELQIGAGSDSNDDVEFYVGGSERLRVDTTYGLRVSSASLYVDGNLTGGNLDCTRDSGSCGENTGVDDNGDGTGTWDSWVYCPTNHYGCGLSQRIDNDGNERQGVTQYRLYCCPF